MAAGSGDTTSYDQATQNLDSFGQAVSRLVEARLADEGIIPHSVSYRVKSLDSATAKLSGSEKYTDYPDLTDLLGIRVITYFADAVDVVAAHLRPEFDIDEPNSVDKRALLDPDRFGYLSLHYIASLKPSRTKLIEYKQFDGLIFELQIRSILQHAWAEIEHDLGYKTAGGLPSQLRRRFSRLASLLELADDEFERLRVDRDSYETRVTEKVESSPDDLEVNQSTVAAVMHLDVVYSLDAEIAGFFARELRDEVDIESAARNAKELRRLGINNLGTLVSVIVSRRPYVIEFARQWLQPSEGRRRPTGLGPLNRGISLFYLRYTLFATADESRRAYWLGRPRGEQILERIDAVWNSVVATLGEAPPVPSDSSGSGEENQTQSSDAQPPAAKRGPAKRRRPEAGS